MKFLRLVLVLLICSSAVSAAPKLYIQPKDGIAPILERIEKAQKSIRHKIYLFTHSRQDVIDALARAIKRGVDVKILLEREPSGTSGGNTAIFLKLREAGLNVGRSRPFEFVFIHEKSFVFDDKEAIVSTANITASSFSANREYLVALDEPALVQEIAKVFDADWEGKDIDLRDSKLVWSPSQTKADGTVRGNSRGKLLELIKNARESLLLEQQSMADEEVIREISSAAQRGVQVTLVGPPNELTNTYYIAGAERLRQAGVKVKYLLTNYVHAKAIIADKKRALVGSINLSGNSLDANRELSVILERETAGEALDALVQQIETDAAISMDVNPFGLPKLEAVQDARKMGEFVGREGVFEGVVEEVERRDAVAFLNFGKGDTAPRGVVFARAYDLFAQPFPQAYLGKRVQLRGRVQLYGDYYEIILNSPDQITVLP
ncbi:MAG: phospholipase D-like domain-containing protein [Deinococcales bacterium]